MRRLCWVGLLLVGCGAAPDVGLPPEPSWPRYAVDSSSTGADGVRLADINADGRPDIATGWEEGGSVRVYLHPGPAAVKRLWPGAEVGAVRSPEDAVFADLDGDGALDVISSTEGDEQTLYVHWAPSGPNEKWRTEPIPASVGMTRWMFALPAEGGFFAGSKDPNGRVGWWQAPEDPRDLAAWEWTTLYEAGWVMSLLARDMDGDGDADLVISDRKGPRRGVLWLEAPDWREHRIGPVDAEEVMFVDVSRDGREVAVAVKDGPAVVYRRSGQEWERTEIPMPPGVGSGKAVAFGDLNLDGETDLALTCEHADGELNGVFWLEGPDWTPHPVSGPEGVKFDRIELVDLDEDGDLDLLTCEERANLGVIWYANPAR